MQVSWGEGRGWKGAGRECVDACIKSITIHAFGYVSTNSDLRRNHSLLCAQYFARKSIETQN